MMVLTDSEIQIVKADLERKGIVMPGLDSDLLDHLLCGIEAHMNSGRSFSEAYHLASYELHGELKVSTIQTETIEAINEGKSLLRNLMHYCLVLCLLVGAFNTFTTGVNPALIIVCIALSILFIYHSIFLRRKANSSRSNLILFTLITALFVFGVLIFLVKEFLPFGMFGTSVWCLIIVSVAIPVYLISVKKILTLDSSLLTFFCSSLNFITIVSLLWVPLALCLKMIRPDVAVFFIDDFLVLAMVSSILSAGLKKWPDLRLYLRDRFS